MQTQDWPSARLGTRGQLDPSFSIGHYHFVPFLKSSSQLFISPTLFSERQNVVGVKTRVFQFRQMEVWIQPDQPLTAWLRQVKCPLWATFLYLQSEDEVCFADKSRGSRRAQGCAGAREDARYLSPSSGAAVQLGSLYRASFCRAAGR